MLYEDEATKHKAIFVAGEPIKRMWSIQQNNESFVKASEFK